MANIAHGTFDIVRFYPTLDVSSECVIRRDASTNEVRLLAAGVVPCAVSSHPGAHTGPDPAAPSTVTVVSSVERAGRGGLWAQAGRSTRR